MQERRKNLNKSDPLCKEIDCFDLKEIFKSMQGTESFEKIKIDLFGELQTEEDDKESFTNER